MPSESYRKFRDIANLTFHLQSAKKGLVAANVATSESLVSLCIPDTRSRWVSQSAFGSPFAIPKSSYNTL